MPTASLRRRSAAGVALLLMVSVGILTKPHALSRVEADARAVSFSFEHRRLELPADHGRGVQSIREVAPRLRRIDAWISSLGAGAALGDLSGDGLPNDLCLVEPRIDAPILMSLRSPEAYAPVLLVPEGVPAGPTTAPMGCLIGDLNQDGDADVLVYYWGRSPVLFLRAPGQPLGRGAFVEQELVEPHEVWNTTAVVSADLDGDGRLDLVVGNYFPDGARLLDPHAERDEHLQMQDSFSRAFNGGRNRVFRLAGLEPAAVPRPRYQEVEDVFPGRLATGWTLALGSADLDGDQLPELYVANDFGPDRLFHNRSAPGRIRLVPVEGRRGFTIPASKVVGRGSFKGMAMELGDLTRNGRLDMFVSNIARDYGLHESHYTWIHTGDDGLWERGRAPYVDESERLGTSRGGWGWDAKFGDFDNSGTLEIVQATGYIRGRTNRWPELQELAMANDDVIRRPESWPRFSRGDDLSGREPNRFFIEGPDGRFHDIASLVGWDEPHVSRGIAVGDIEGNGLLDLVIANQWEDSFVARNRCAPGACGGFVGLDLLLPVDGNVPRSLVEAGRRASAFEARPAVGAQALVVTDANVRLVHVDGGSGHAGRRDPSIHVGLGDETPTRIVVSYRDADGTRRRLDLPGLVGWHTVLLGADGEEVS